ncbi:MAG: response regulator, partial [Succinivibrionaceae bacterium]|nr:response regulator [Succinivibrionaceae bacterium]
MIAERQFPLDGEAGIDGVAREIARDPRYGAASAVLVKINSAQLASPCLGRLYERLHAALPKAVFHGMSISNRDDGPSSHAAVITVDFFESSQVAVLSAPCAGEGYAALGRRLGERLDALPWVRAVEVVSSGPTLHFERFLEELSHGREAVCFFGSEAGYVERGPCGRGAPGPLAQGLTPGQGKERVVLGEDGPLTEGVSLLAYCGEALRVKGEALLGWNPIGKELTITSMAGDYCVETIDGLPAASIFERYLNVRNDEYFLRNICAFPIVTVRNGYEVARIPPFSDAQGRLHFASDVHEGERYRISYAIAPQLLGQARERSHEMAEFGPQILSLYVCANRMFFLGDDEQQEIDCYLHCSPTALKVMGISEIFRQGGQGGVLNSTLVAVGMSEGGDLPTGACEVPRHEDDPSPQPQPGMADVDDPSLLLDVTRETDATVPLYERLANFLSVVTAELGEAVGRARRASEVKSQFLSNMSHEIRTPINTILGMNEMILREASDPAILGYARSVRSAGDTLLALVNDILDFSKIEAGKMEIIPVDYALSSMLTDLHSMLFLRASAKDLDFGITAPATLPSVLRGDELRIRQVLTNFLTNAIKYTRQGGVTLAVEELSRTAAEITLRFSVTDTGMGMREADLPRLTEAFERIDEERNRTIEGTGLGMSITSRLLRLMGSSLKVRSEYGVGSTFSFDLTQQVVLPEAMGEIDFSGGGADDETRYERTFTAPHARILVVDDTEMNLTVLRALLKETQVQVVTALSGQAALDAYPKERFDLVLLDHRMPGMDGVETLGRLRELQGGEGRRAPIIALTANAVAGAREFYLGAGFDGYLSKPVRPRDLERALITHLPPELVTLTGRTSDGSEGDLPEWLSAVKCLDCAEGLGLCGSAESYLEALRIFASGMDESLLTLEGFLAAEDLKGFTVKVHALKSSAKIIGNDLLSEHARALEEAGNAQDLGRVREGFPALRDCMLRLRAAL